MYWLRDDHGHRSRVCHNHKKSFNLRHILKRRLASRPILTEGQNDSRSGEESIDEERMGFHGHGYCTSVGGRLLLIVVG